MKLLASDVDQTLLFDGKYIKEEDIKEIKRLQNDGHVFGVCTGRSLEGVLKPSEQYNIDYDYYIVLSGAMIYNKKRELIFEKRIPIELMEEIYESLKPDDMTIVIREKMFRICQDDEDEYFSQRISSIHDLSSDYVNAFSIHFPKDQIEKASKATEYLKERFDDKIGIFQNNEHIDLAMKGCSKGHGLKFIQDYFHIHENDIYCIGDSWNDLPMFEAAKHPFTFTYAPISVQEKAEVIVESIAECIKHILK